MRTLVNAAYDPAAVPAPSGEALAFHRGLEGYRPTPLRDLGGGVRDGGPGLRGGLGGGVADA